MDVHSLSGAASALSGNLRALTTQVVEQVQDPALFGDPALESTIELILDRLCLSIQLSKPVGLATWAVREGRRLGPARAMELAGAAAHVIASEANRFEIDHGRLLAFLEVLKTDIQSALSALGGDSCEERSAHSESTQALLAMLGERDSQTCCHSKATGEWARRLCIAMGLASDLSDFIELCALLHDIGKISTPDSILNKPGPLTSAEWDIMRDHAAAGQRILNQIPTLSRCALIVRAHHERWDGLGYPDALVGENIPFEARVVAVADAFHAMISDRPYRKAIPPRRALEILQSGRGTQWDPLVVDSMLGLFTGASKQSAVRKRASSA
ncbi:MAG TPA: HD-GYP domain-containing protein [Candidatus Baltobacteraceae bacterium]|nr:HD-GYP domain-containing protein [Candidatus Baltobacteraceae bacterium]